MDERKIKLMSLRVIELVFSLLMTCCMATSNVVGLNGYLIGLNVLSVFTVILSLIQFFTSIDGIALGSSSLCFVYFVIACILNGKTNNLTSYVTLLNLGLSSSIIVFVFSIICFVHFCISNNNQESTNQHNSSNTNTINKVASKITIDKISNRKINSLSINKNNFNIYFRLEREEGKIKFVSNKEIVKSSIDILLSYTFDGKTKERWECIKNGSLVLSKEELGIKGNLNDATFKVIEAMGEINFYIE